MAESEQLEKFKAILESKLKRFPTWLQDELRCEVLSEYITLCEIEKNGK